jgi:hypothetical protein
MHPGRGAFSREIFFFFPGYAKDAYPGLMSFHASRGAARRAAWNLAPGGASFATPRRGAFSREIFFFFPGYAKDAYPGLMSFHASGVAQPEGLHGKSSPGWSVFCDTPDGVRFRVKSFSFPRVRKRRVPGANVLSRLRVAQPEGLQGT